MIRRLKENESGAALMIVLILVVVASIVGTTMLTTTTYGLQNVVKNTKEQEEFYRAEGALEIVLAEMSKYQNVSTGNSGPYAFVKDMVNNTKLYQIGNRDVKVTVSSKEISAQKLEVTLKAQYADNNQSKLTRNLIFEVAANYNPLPRTKTAYGYVTQEHYIDKEQFADGLKDHIMQVNYEQIIKDLGIVWTSYTSTITNQDLKADGTYTFPTGITKLKEITISGSGTKIIIPEGAIVYVQTVTLGGNGNDTTQLTVDGALITERIYHKGNSILTLNSGLVANYYNGTSNQFKVEGPGKGIDCTLLPTACTVINGGETTNQYVSSPDATSIRFSTSR